MNRVTIKTTKRADKNLLKIRKIDRTLFNKITEAIDELRLNPFIGELKTGDLAGIYSYDISHMRTNYEMAYHIEEEIEGEYVLILLIGPRENFYEDLKRYIK